MVSMKICIGGDKKMILRFFKNATLKSLECAPLIWTRLFAADF